MTEREITLTVTTEEREARPGCFRGLPEDWAAPEPGEVEITGVAIGCRDLPDDLVRALKPYLYPLLED